MLHQLRTTGCKALSHCFEGMPVRSLAYSHPLDHDLWCVDSDVSISSDTGEEHLFTGHAAATDRSAALQRSCYEIIERLAATRLVQGDDQASQGWTAQTVFGQIERGKLDASEVLVRESAGHGPGASASGLGIHFEQDLAIRHGLFELIERHMALQWWYNDAPPLICTRSESLPDGFRVNYLTTANAVPFVLAVMRNREQDMIFCGSAVRTSLADAEAHAREECLHLAANYLVHRHFDDDAANGPPLGNVAATIARIALLRGPVARSMLDHVDRRTANGSTIPPKATAVGRITEAALGSTAEPWFVSLGRWQDRLEVVRVVCRQALTKQAVRQTFAPLDHVTDPFC